MILRETKVQSHIKRKIDVPLEQGMYDDDLMMTMMMTMTKKMTTPKTMMKTMMTMMDTIKPAEDTVRKAADIEKPSKFK
jgi:hypothetical protein